MVARHDEIWQAQRSARCRAGADRSPHKPCRAFDRGVGHGEIWRVGKRNTCHAELCMAEIDHPFDLVMGCALRADFPEGSGAAFTNLTVGCNDRRPLRVSPFASFHLL